MVSLPEDSMPTGGGRRMVVELFLALTPSFLLLFFLFSEVFLYYIFNDSTDHFVYLSSIFPFKAYRMCIQSIMTSGDSWFYFGEVLEQFRPFGSLFRSLNWKY